MKHTTVIGQIYAGFERTLRAVLSPAECRRTPQLLQVRTREKDLLHLPCFHVLMEYDQNSVDKNSCCVIDL